MRFRRAERVRVEPSTGPKSFVQLCPRAKGFRPTEGPKPRAKWQTVSIRRPCAGCRELQRVTRRIAKIDASTSALPPDAALNRDTVVEEMPLPLIERVGGHCESDVHWTVSVVRWNPSAEQVGA